MKWIRDNRYGKILAIILICAVLLSACSILLNPDEGSKEESLPTDEEEPLSENLTSQEQALDSGDDIPLEPLVDGLCPKEGREMTGFFLITHSWDFSPNRDQEMMKVTGQTAEVSMCPLKLVGTKFSAKPCSVPFNNTGFIKTDDGMCDVTASGSALIEFEDGYCENGVVTVTVVENLDTDAAYNGAMNCPNVSQPYAPTYPPSRTTVSFKVDSSGSTASESLDPDLTNQFKYDKKWTLLFDDLID
jgi:hypothetical protein